MALEDNIKLIVEQVLNQINEKNKEAAQVPAQQEKKAACPAGTDEAILDDITQVDLQKYLQVPNPVNGDFYREMKNATPARIGVWRAGTRPLTDTLLRFRADHATAQDAVLNDVSEEFIQDFDLVKLQSACRDKDEFLTRPDLGRKLSPESVETLGKTAKAGAELQIIIADGLSSTAVETNVPDLLPALLQGLSNVGVSVGTPVFVKYGRVAVMDCIGEELKPQAAIMLIGERPGLGTAESLSAYLAYNPRVGMLESERTVVSNIHKGGTPPSEAGAHLSSVVKAILERKASGVNFSF